MPILRIVQNAVGADEYNVTATLTIDGQATQTASAKFRFTLTPQDREDIRWYLEDYLQYSMYPAPAIAARIERRMEEIGGELFDKLFPIGSDNYGLWVKVCNRLSDVRVEISTEVAEAASIPWELLREPKADTLLAISTKEFTRVKSDNARKPKMPQPGGGAIRILFVICRPDKGDDVPFRSVAGRIIQTLDMENSGIEFTVLRPPTFARLRKVLRDAKEAGAPFHVVHFDGHGVYRKYSEDEHRGYLVFENPKSEVNVSLVDGENIGELLNENDVFALILNACRSAHADTPDKPLDKDDDVYNQTRSFSSLALEVVDAGVAGVVAMRYNVYVVTAAQFVADLYTALLSGRSLGEAVAEGRKRLKAQPNREIAFESRPLQDWVVPIVYEAAPIKLFKQRKKKKLTINPKIAAGAGQEPDQLRAPDVGFFGRDETILALDRAFDTQHVVLLHAYAGSGKTTTAGEFARWYAKTGGLQGPVLFNSFQFKTTLSGVLTHFGMAFEMELQQKGINWSALDEQARREEALRMLEEIPALWIWDNVEPITGFPRGVESQWSTEEQEKLLDFLRDASRTRAKFLLTSRRDEMDWLRLLPARVTLPPMREMVSFTRAIADKYQRKITDIEIWKPLLDFTLGNPLTLMVVVEQALKDSLSSKKQLAEFVEKLRAGELEFDNEEQGRLKSLRASLKYGFENAFSEKELKVLSLLHFFQGFVDTMVLETMISPKEPFYLREIEGLPVENGLDFLFRAMEIGLMKPLGCACYYAVHPALPWFLKNLFRRCYKTPEQRIAAARAFVEAMGDAANYYHDQYGEEDHSVIHILEAEEENLLYAYRLAKKNRWISALTSVTQGLCVFYEETSGSEKWDNMVQELIQYVADTNNDFPLPGMEEDWMIVTQYRISIALRKNEFKEAERLQLLSIDIAKKLYADIFPILPEDLDDSARNSIRTMAVLMENLGNIQCSLKYPECIKAYEEAIKMFKYTDDRAGEAMTALNMGSAFIVVSEIRDLQKAKHWFNIRLQLYDSDNNAGKGKCFRQLGHVEYESFIVEGSKENPDKNKVRKHLKAARSYYLKAVKLLPDEDMNGKSDCFSQLGIICDALDEIENARKYYDKAAKHYEQLGDLHSSGIVCHNLAAMYYNSDSFDSALNYTQAALRYYEKCGEYADDEIEQTNQLIKRIRAAMQFPPP